MSRGGKRAGGLAAALALLVAGCSTSGPYIPQTLGSLEDPQDLESLEVLIDARDNIARIGEPIVFRILIRNSGDRAFWIPRDPDVLFTWTYPNGRHDNFIRDFENERYYHPSEAVLLKPGEYLTKHVTIKTYYFDRAGITEFRALLHASRNTNPGLSPFWHGKALSNAFGVMVQPKKRRGFFSSSAAQRGTARVPAS